MKTLEPLQEFVVRAYDAEIARKDEVLQRAGIAAAVLGFCANIANYVALDYRVQHFAPWHLFFYMPMAVGVGLGGVSLVILGRMFARKVQYRYIPDTAAVVHYAEKLEKWSGGDADAKVEQLQRELIGSYSKCATRNREITAARFEKIATALRAAIWCLGLIFVSLPGYYFYQLDYPEKVTAVRMTEPLKTTR